MALTTGLYRHRLGTFATSASPSSPACCPATACSGRLQASPCSCPRLASYLVVPASLSLGAFLLVRNAGWNSPETDRVCFVSSSPTRLSLPFAGATLSVAARCHRIAAADG